MPPQTEFCLEELRNVNRCMVTSLSDVTKGVILSFPLSKGDSGSSVNVNFPTQAALILVDK
jgi:hypothetical protein